MRKSQIDSINRYIKATKNTDWVLNEDYKFVCANYVNKNIDWDNQNDRDILEVLIQSQEETTYRGSGGKFKGVPFITRVKQYHDEYISVKDVKLFRQIRNGKNIEDVDWKNKKTEAMSFPVLSVWLSFLFPDKIYPIILPTKTKIGFNETISFLFGSGIKCKRGLEYIIECQSFMEETEKILKQYPLEKHLLEKWGEYYRDNSRLKLKIIPKNKLEKVDWVWLTQDFHLFVQRKVLAIANGKISDFEILNEYEEKLEGSQSLVTHKRYERNQSLIRTIKQKAFKKNKMLNCEICGFSFLDTYGEIGAGFIEAHHINPLNEREGEKVTKSKDITLVCSNCHRMLHKKTPVYSIQELKDKLNENS